MNDPSSSEIEPELCGKPPRRVRDSAATRTMRRVVWNAFLALFCLTYYLASRDIAEWDDLAKHGVVEVAHVVGKEEYQGKSRSYTLHFSYLVDGHSDFGIVYVNAERYARAVEGDTLTVTYSPHYPADVKIGRVTASTVASRRSERTVLIWGVGIVLLMAGSGMEGCIATGRQQLAEGIAARAQVVSRRQETQKATLYFLKYQYLAPDRGERTFECAVSEDEYKRFPEGSWFTILYPPGESYSPVPYFRIWQAELAY